VDSSSTVQKTKKRIERGGREERIIEYLKENGWSTVRDVLSQFPGVNQKTIQRDLLHLTDEGILKKEGDKRWRKYALQND